MPESTSPADTLKALELNLEENQRGAARLKAQIADVKKTVDDIDQKTKDVDKSSTANDETYQKLKEWADCKEKALKGKVPDPKAVAEKETAGSKEVADLKKKAEDAGRAIWPLEVEVAKRKVDTAAAQKYFDEVANIPARNAEILKEAADFQKKADAEETAKNCSRAYFYVLVILDLLGRYDRRTPAQYAKLLKHAGNVLAGAVKNQREAEEKLEAAKSYEKAAIKKYEERKAKWVQESVDSLPKQDCKKTTSPPCEPPKGGYEPPKEPPKGYEPPKEPPKYEPARGNRPKAKSRPRDMNLPKDTSLPKGTNHRKVTSRRKAKNRLKDMSRPRVMNHPKATNLQKAKNPPRATSLLKATSRPKARSPHPPTPRNPRRATSLRRHHRRRPTMTANTTRRITSLRRTASRHKAADTTSKSRLD